MKNLKFISVILLFVFNVLFASSYIITYELESNTLLPIGQCVELTDVDNHCRLSNNDDNVIGFVALSETDGLNYYNLVVNSGRITGRLSAGENVPIGAKLTVSHIAGELAEATSGDRVIAIATEAVNASYTSKKIEIIIQFESPRDSTAFFADSALHSDTSDFAQQSDTSNFAHLSNTSNFAWQVPCDTINKCINWDTLSAYSDTTHTHYIGELIDVDTSGVVIGQILKWDGTNWVPANDSTGPYVPESLFIWNQDTITQHANLKISGTATVGTLAAIDIRGQGNAHSDVASAYNIYPVDTNISLTNLTYYAGGPGSKILLSFNGVFDDQNGLNGANFAVEIVRNPGPSEIVVAETEVFIYSDDYYKIKPVAIKGIDSPTAGNKIYEVRARTLSEPFIAGRCLRGRLILTEIKE